MAIITKNIYYAVMGEMAQHDSVFLELNNKVNMPTIGAVYRPPFVPTSFLKELCDNIILHVIDRSDLIMPGDFNIADILWNKSTPSKSNVN